MAYLNLMSANWNFTQAKSFLDGFLIFVQDHSLAPTIISESLASFATWLSLLYFYAPIPAWAITFTVLVLLGMGFDFGRLGVALRSRTAALQGRLYGGFTPAGGWFATLTSLGMKGILVPAVAIISAIVATEIAIMLWACSVAREDTE